MAGAENDLFEAVEHQTAANVIQHIEQCLVPNGDRARLVGPHVEAAVPIGHQRGHGNLRFDGRLQAHIIAGIGVHAAGQSGTVLFNAANRDNHGVGFFQPLLDLHP